MFCFSFIFPSKLISNQMLQAFFHSHASICSTEQQDVILQLPFTLMPPYFTTILVLNLVLQKGCHSIHKQFGIDYFLCWEGQQWVISFSLNRSNADALSGVCTTCTLQTFAILALFRSSISLSL